jgi:hypothetical protein
VDADQPDLTNIIDALTNWDEPDPEMLDDLLHKAMHAADTAAIAAAGTAHDKVKAAVRASLRMLLANGLVTAVPREEWPEYVRIDAP